MKRITHLLCLLLFLIPFLSINAQDKDLVEQNFPNLKKVHAKEDISNGSRIVLIAHENNNFYVMQDSIQKEEKTLVPVTQLSTQNKAIDWNKHSFILHKNSCLEGFHTRMYYQYKNKYSEKTLLHILASKPRKKADKLYLYDSSINDGKTLCTTPDQRILTLNNNLDKCGMYTTKSHILLIYLYNESNVPEPLGNISIKTQEGYGTIYTNESYVMPDGLTGFTVTGANNVSKDLTLNPCYKGGDPVPEHTALLVKGAKGDYPYYATPTTTRNSRNTSTSDNLLRGSATKCETTAPDNSNNYYFYKLYYLLDAETGNKRLGFFWGAENGAPFMNAANKAYLALPKQESLNIRGFVLPDEHTTGIENVTTDRNSKQNGIYNLNGVKINQTSTTGLPTGWYIVNGKKTWVR